MVIPIGDDIAYAAKLILEGKLVAFPTETVYGLGADSLNVNAVVKVFEVKQRPTFDPLIVHIHDLSQLDILWLKPFNKLALKLAQTFWPGPLTIVHPKSSQVHDIITSGLSNVAVRMPSNTVARRLLELTHHPIVAPSANKFGALTSTKAEHVTKQFNVLEVAYVLELQEDMQGIESTVVLIENNNCIILRDGAISQEEIENQVHIRVVRLNNCSDNFNNRPLDSPGLLKSHYAPKKPLYIITDLYSLNSLPVGSGVILHSKKDDNLCTNAVKILYTSTNFTYAEIAQNLFNVLHIMDDSPEVIQIFIEAVTEQGLGRAIMDRIKKAAFKYISQT